MWREKVYKSTFKTKCCISSHTVPEGVAGRMSRFGVYNVTCRSQGWIRSHIAPCGVTGRMSHFGVYKLSESAKFAIFR